MKRIRPKQCRNPVHLASPEGDDRFPCGIIIRSDRKRAAEIGSVTCGKCLRSGTPESRFWKNVNKDGSLILDTRCWEWTAGCAQGYGYFWYKKKHIYAHRFAMGVKDTSGREDLFICHKCDNPPCVNPAHLFFGTPLDNLLDCKAKGRFRTSSARLTPTLAMNIRRLRDQGMTQLEIQRSVGIGEKAVRRVVQEMAQPTTDKPATKDQT